MFSHCLVLNNFVSQLRIFVFFQNVLSRNDRSLRWIRSIQKMQRRHKTRFELRSVRVFLNSFVVDCSVCGISSSSWSGHVLKTKLSFFFFIWKNAWSDNGVYKWFTCLCSWNIPIYHINIDEILGFLPLRKNYIFTGNTLKISLSFTRRTMRGYIAFSMVKQYAPSLMWIHDIIRLTCLFPRSLSYTIVH